MRFRIVTSLLLAVVLAALVYMTESGSARPGPGDGSLQSPASSADDKVMKNLKIE